MNSLTQTITWYTPDEMPTEDGFYFGFFWIDHLGHHELRPLSWHNGTWHAGTLPASISAPLDLFCLGKNKFLAWSCGPNETELLRWLDLHPIGLDKCKRKEMEQNGY